MLRQQSDFPQMCIRDSDNADELTLTPKGRYLVVVMMRQFFIGVNNLRDQARAALTGEERELIFGDGKDCGIVVAKPVSADVVAAEIAREEEASDRKSTRLNSSHRL